jgi:hypothetical protein
MHYTGVICERGVFGQVLAEMVDVGKPDKEQAYHLMRNILHDTIYEG